MMHAWEEAGCRLAADPILLANLTKIDPARWGAVGTRVLSLLWRREGEYYVCADPDLAALAEHAEARREQQRRAGIRSAQARRERDGTAQPRKPEKAVGHSPNGRSDGNSVRAERANAGADDGADAEDGVRLPGGMEAVTEEHAGSLLDDPTAFARRFYDGSDEAIRLASIMLDRSQPPEERRRAADELAAHDAGPRGSA